MNQLCRVCGEPAAGFHFGAFTCEGCKSFFGRTYNNLSSISECKNGGQCIINKKNRTSCKACRLRKCLVVGMSKSGSRYGRRSNWFKIHCLLQEQSNNNNNNTIQQTTIENNKLISSKNSDTSTSSWHKKPANSEQRNLPNLSELRNYGSSENAASLAAAAAAFWASRGNLIPQLPSPDMSNISPSSQVPISPFLASPFSNRNFLFPYLSPPIPTTLKSTVSPPPSSTSSSSCCSSPKPIEEEGNSQQLSGIELLRTLGPVQEKPMDLSVKSNPISDSESDKLDSKSIKSLAGDEVDSDGKLQHPGKPPTPLDLSGRS